METFILDGISYTYARPDRPPAEPEEVQSWEYGNYPKVQATILTDGGTLDVYGEVTRWSPTHIIVEWADDNKHRYWTWVPKEDVRRVTDSEWDIDQYLRGLPELRNIQWGNRLPGFLPCD